MINGIKPDIKPKTLLNSTTPFGEAMDNFLAKLTENGKEYIKKYRLIDDVVFKTDGGRKYIKVKYFTDRIDTDYETGKKTLVHDERGSIHCFVESTTGDIYKPATWRAPYNKGKNCVRGNIYDASSFDQSKSFCKHGHDFVLKIIFKNCAKITKNHLQELKKLRKTIFYRSLTEMTF